MQKDLREITLKVPFPGNPKSASETWITLLEQWLSCNFKGYTVTVTQDSYQRNTDIKINFANIEDATFFKLKYYQENDCKYTI
jgi:hypothetical protein